MRWTIGILTGFVVLITVNAGFLYLAFSGMEPVAPSYLEERR